MKHIDLDSLPSYTKQELAAHQLDRAIRLLLDDDDAVCAITLAGAAEEILGKLIEINGGTHSLKEFIDECLACGRRVGEDWKQKEFADMANHFRNELKHYVEGSDVTVSAECAHQIIDRATENLWRLTGRQSEQVRRYMSHVHGV
jgi:hypothetical protein